MPVVTGLQDDLIFVTLEPSCVFVDFVMPRLELHVCPELAEFLARAPGRDICGEKLLPVYCEGVRRSSNGLAIVPSQYMCIKQEDDQRIRIVGEAKAACIVVL